MLEWVDHVGAVLGAGGSGVAGFVLNKFKAIEKNAESALLLAQTLRSEVEALKRQLDGVEDDVSDEKISKADLAVESLQGQLEAVRRELQMNTSRIHTLEQEFRAYAQREVEKWTDLIRDVAEIRGSLRDPSAWRR